MNLKYLGLLAALPILLATAPVVSAADIETGLYLRTTYAFGNLSINTFYIGKDSTIVINPKNGIDPFDFDAAAKNYPGEVGAFKIEGDKIIVTWKDKNKKVETLSVEFKDGKLSAYDGGLVSKAEAYPKNKTLSATYAGSGQTANVSSTRTLTLTADGKYTMSTVGGVRGIPGNTGVAEKTVQGTYKLEGNTLVLTASGGEVTKHTVLPFDTALDPKQAVLSDDHMIFDGANLKREK